MTDTEAMDAIHAVMSGEMWSADTLDAIAAVVTQTGREIAPPAEDEEEDYDLAFIESLITDAASGTVAKRANVGADVMGRLRALPDVPTEQADRIRIRVLVELLDVPAETAETVVRGREDQPWTTPAPGK